MAIGHKEDLGEPKKLAREEHPNSGYEIPSTEYLLGLPFT
jgi:hypothetical protein